MLLALWQDGHVIFWGEYGITASGEVYFARFFCMAFFLHVALWWIVVGGMGGEGIHAHFSLVVVVMGTEWLRLSCVLHMLHLVLVKFDMATPTQFCAVTIWEVNFLEVSNVESPCSNRNMWRMDGAVDVWLHMGHDVHYVTRLRSCIFLKSEFPVTQRRRFIFRGKPWARQTADLDSMHSSRTLHLLYVGDSIYLS